MGLLNEVLYELVYTFKRFLTDERFFKTVIYMCAHSSEGSMGIIINKKIDYVHFPNLLEQLGIDKPINNKIGLQKSNK